MVKQDLKLWVKNSGSLRRASEILDIPISTLSAYCRGTRYPHPLIMCRLRQRLGDVVDLDMLSTAWADRKNTPPPSSRLMRGNVLVNSLDKLSRLYVEADLDRTGLRDAPRYLARWQATNVTAKEVREAIEALNKGGKNGADVRLIHEFIGAKRRAYLGGLKE